MSSPIRSSFAFAGFASIVFTTAALSCSPPSKGELERNVSTRATPGSFRAAGVSAVFERRCGSIDCHGSIARNLRIYSSRGLRLPNDGGLVPGSGDTSNEEVTANYQSVMTLEPELTNAVIDGADPYTLLILKKPLDIEKHKGGQTMRRGEDAETCIVSWLKEEVSAPVNQVACTNAANFPRE